MNALSYWKDERIYILYKWKLIEEIEEGEKIFKEGEKLFNNTNLSIEKVFSQWGNTGYMIISWKYLMSKRIEFVLNIKDSNQFDGSFSRPKEQINLQEVIWDQY